MSKKVAIVTGGNSGIGLATAKKFCDEGYTTYIIGRSEVKLEKACEMLGPNAISRKYDLDCLEGIPELISGIAREAGQIDVLVNNAGINMKKPLLEVTDEDFQKIIHTNLVSVFAMTRETVREMKKNGGGSIVNISSMAAQYGLPLVVAYSSSKTAIEGFTRALAVELAEFGIRVNCIAPGFIETPMSSKALSEDENRKSRVMARTPMGKLGQTDDVAMSVFFLSGAGSKYTTGVVLPVDGGNCIGF